MYRNILQKILSKSCELSELTETQIKTSRTEDARMARRVLIEVLANYYTDNEISNFLGVKRQRVNVIRNESKHNQKRPFNERILLRDLSMYAKEIINEIEMNQRLNQNQFPDF